MLPVVSGMIWFYRKPIDFRKQLNGLIMLIADELGQNPANGDLYVFRSKKATQIKMIFWQYDGFWLYQKRLEGKRFRFPTVSENQMVITSSQIQWLISGLSIQHAPKETEPPKRFF